MEKLKYDITIIIPVYNNENYIDACMQSLLEQNFPLEKIQIILINDGSTDKSLAVCKTYEKENILVIDKENSGVSATRNIGLKKALGKYILFLDSDDYLSKNTLKSLFSFFEKHEDEIDLITYPIVYDKQGKYSSHVRYKNMFKEGSGIYDLEEHFNLIQATVNIMIKNAFKKNLLFDEKQTFSEDEHFATEILMKKKKIGFCKEATYYYRRHAETANDTLTNAYYSFEMITGYYESLFNKYKKDGKVPKYIQALYLNNVSWRIKQDALYPYHYEKEEFKQAKERIIHLLKQMDMDVILSLPYMSSFHRMYLLHLRNDKVEVKISDKNSLIVTTENNIITEEETITSWVNRFKICDDFILLDGNFTTLVFEIVKPEIYLEIEDKKHKKEEKRIDVFRSNSSYQASKIRTNTIYGYQIKIPLNIDNFTMFTIIKGKKIPIYFKFNQFASRKIYDHHIRVAYSMKKFRITKNSFYYKLKDFGSNFITYLKKNPKILIYRFLGKIAIKKRKIWLYTDKSGVLDNGYIQFQHDIKKKDGIERYYVYNEPYNKIKKKIKPEEEKYLLKFKSIKHIQKYLRADVILSSFADLQVYCPFNTGIKWYHDILHYDLVYLQHGILHANLIKMYSKEFTEISKFIISSPFEEKNLIEKYHYREEDFIKSGMPRESLKKKNVKVKNKILYAPSWREYLIGKMIKNKRELKENVFLNSNYFKETYAFLHSKKLSEFLEKNDYILDFQLHPIFRDYAHLFELQDSKNIHLTSGSTILEEYKMFITDFSSFQFDYIFLKRPIIYFVPDMEEFKAGLHTYRELDLKYEDAFGELCLTSDELLEKVLSYEKRNFQLEEKYKERMANFFYEIKNPCEKIYNSLKK